MNEPLPTGSTEAPPSRMSRSLNGAAAATGREQPRPAPTMKPSRENSPDSGSLASPPAEQFYLDVLRVANASGVPFLVGGTYAVNGHTGVVRPTKDLDLFCRAGDFPKLLEAGAAAGFQIEVLDERWIAKLRRGMHFVDVIFSSSNGAAPVNDQWFTGSHAAEVLGVTVQLLPPTELIWSKAFIQDRGRYDGSDVAHTILRKHADIDWRRLLAYFDQYWEVLLIHLLNFRFVYPSERDFVPRWLVDELLDRLHHQLDMPSPTRKTCRGPLFSPGDYDIDLRDWGFGGLTGL